MPTASESRAALTLVTGEAVAVALGIVAAGVTRDDLLGSIPDVIGYYSLGSSALAADFYDDERDRAGVRGRFLADPVVLDRGEKIGRAVAWATEPMVTQQGDVVGQLAEVVRMETARPYRDTILENRRRDPAAVGWRRITHGDACRFCQMLAARGAVYTNETARFAAHGKHTNGSGGTCQCTAQPVFKGEEYGEEASVLQYVASKRRTTEKDRARVRAYLDEHFPEGSGVTRSSTSTTRKVEPARGAAGGLNALTRSQVELQLRITEGLKESEWRTHQLARLRKQLASM